MAKFPIFIRPTLAGCFEQGIVPVNAIRSIASWYVFAATSKRQNPVSNMSNQAGTTFKRCLGTDAFIPIANFGATFLKPILNSPKPLRREINELEQMAGLTLRDVRKSYGERKSCMASILILKMVNLLCSSARRAVVNPPCLRMIAGLEEISEGTVAIGDRS